ncbi:MAG: O-glycosyl hydrolase [Firmicutes bacterium]|nr:O-glycosyl hydrolase [Bacillota bacterium]
MKKKLLGLIGLLGCISFVNVSNASAMENVQSPNNIKWVSSTSNEVWTEVKPKFTEATGDTLELTGEKYQIINGFGGCFNELGGIALSKLKETKRNEVISALFSDDGLKLNFNRLPIGANDYAQDWYSYDETDGDYAMENFSIERDKRYLIPYVKEAQILRSDMKFFASPWSPPTWMKTSKAYNNGRLKMDNEILDAYALYLKKYVDAYKTEGIDINQIHVQNEPFANQKFPSCLWSGEQFRVFIKDYLGPLFEKEHVPAEIWLGTLNGPTLMSFSSTGAITLDSYDEYVDRVLFDKEARKYIKGVGYQWAGQNVIQRTHDSFPELKLMQTESECGDSTNTWEYAQYVFGLMRHYFTNGANNYTFWNMVLEPHGVSTWGWPQNSLITVEPDTNTIIYNPEFYLLKHFSHFISPGATRIGIKGHWNGSALAFENPNGEIVIVVNNAVNSPRTFNFKGQNQEFSVELKPNSFNTFVLNK